MFEHILCAALTPLPSVHLEIYPEKLTLSIQTLLSLESYHTESVEYAGDAIVYPDGELVFDRGTAKLHHRGELGEYDLAVECYDL